MNAGRPMRALALLIAAMLCAPVYATELVLVAGASGRTGFRIAESLRAAGYAVRPLTSNRQRAIDRHGGDWDWFEGDVRDAARMAAAMDGADFVICAIGARDREGPNGPEFVDFGGVVNLTDAATAAGVRHFVLISSAAAGPHRQRITKRFSATREWKTRGEMHLKLSGLSYTIIGPGGLSDEPATGAGVRVLTRRDYSGGWIATGDVATLAVDALSNVDAHGKTFAAIRDDELGPDQWRGLLREIPLDEDSDESPQAAD
ncbi:MAG: SDR family oxidoreductase [Gammaproteobacteria bacterium]|nr:SDR family oxidoreductase [Gammaproteobacteria bacterium]